MDAQIEIQNLAEAIAADPHNADLHYDLASVYHDAGRWQEAIREYLTVIDLNPSNDAVYNDLGMIYEHLGDSAMAEDTYRQAIALDPQDATSYHNLGLFYQAQGRIADARQELEQALALATDANEAQETQAAINGLSPDIIATTQPAVGTVTAIPLVGKTFCPRAAAYIIDNL
ncbi:MAG: tetratricopeptide repeat protein, partial [Chloroflexota bacterium]|nr:tetratricopeptide repeat protein [Chloroflexota bacterium]